MGSSTKYKCAVIGLGNIGFKFNLDPKRKGCWSHVTAYEQCQQTQLVGVVEIDANNREAFSKERPQIASYQSIEDLFLHQKVDIVSVCVPTAYHYQICLKILNYPVKAIFCEKPLSFSIDESRELVEQAQKKNVLLAVNYTRRWQESYLRVKEVIERGEIGKVKTIQCFYPAQIYNIGSHLLSVVTMLSRIDPVLGSSMVMSSDADPAISGWLKCQDDLFLSLTSTGKREDLIFEIDVIGSQGRIRVIENGDRVEVFQFEASSRYSGYRELMPVNFDFDLTKDRFISAVTNIVDVLNDSKVKLLCSGADALHIDYLCENFIKSAILKEELV